MPKVLKSQVKLTFNPFLSIWAYLCLWHSRSIPDSLFARSHSIERDKHLRRFPACCLCGWETERFLIL